MYSPVNSETTLQRLSFEASLLLPNWSMVEENSNWFVWCASQSPWNRLLLVQRGNLMKLKKILPPSFSAPLDWSLCLWNSVLQYIYKYCYTLTIFSFFIEIWGIYHTIDLSYVSMQFLFLLFFNYTFKIVQLSPVSKSRIFSSLQ